MLVGIDIETTGLEHGWHEILEVGLAPLDGSPPFECLLAPLHPERADGGATAVHGIDPYHVALHPDDAADLLLEWIGTRTVTPIAHNWQFEYAFLFPWLGRAGFEKAFGRRGLCTYQHALARGGFDRYSLAHLTDYYGILNPTPHRALSDARACGELYQRLSNDKRAC